MNWDELQERVGHLKASRRPVIERIPKEYTYSADIIAAENKIIKCRYSMSNQLAYHLMELQKLIGEDSVIGVHRIVHLNGMLTKDY